MRLFGLDIRVTPDVPKIKLGPGDYVTPEFRAEIDAWLLEFFGTTNLLANGQTLVMESTKVIYMNPRTFAELKKATP